VNKRTALFGISAVLSVVLSARVGAEERPPMAVFLAKALGLQWP